jgi:hypothetical protein
MKLNFAKLLLTAEDYLGFPISNNGGLYQIPPGAYVHLASIAADYGYAVFAAAENTETGEYLVDIYPISDL